MTVPHQDGSWYKSSYSTQTDNCVEVALVSPSARVRDTKAREQGNLEVSARAWRTLVEGL